MKRIRRKKTFTLLETALAFSILAIILAFLFMTLRSSSSLSSKIDLAQRLIFSRYHLHERLAHTLCKIELCSNIQVEHGASALYTAPSEGGPQALHFVFHNGVDPEEAFTGPLHGKLYLDHHSLFLDISPMDASGTHPIRRELLCTHISSLEWCFYKIPSPTTQASYQTTTRTALEKTLQWSESEGTMPYCMTLSLHLQDGSDLDYSFFLSSRIQPIHYEL